MKVLAVDLGSSSARIMLADSEDNSFVEIERISHTAILDEENHLRWNIKELFEKLKNSLKIAIKSQKVQSIGICSWGVDYGVITQDGKFLDLPYCYRDERSVQTFNKLHGKCNNKKNILKLNFQEESVCEKISLEEMFEKTGIYPNPINTVYQLLADKKQNRYKNEKVKIALIADLFAYYLTGNIKAELSNASTTGLLNLFGDNWNFEIIERLGIDKDIFPEVIEDGKAYGTFEGIEVLAVPSHDTASAIYAIGKMPKDTAFLSSGSWLLVGKVIDEPICTKTAFESGYTNERVSGKKVSLLDNINGLFIIQRLVAENNLSYKEIDKKMPTAKVLGELKVDLLMSPLDMTGDMKKQLKLENCDIFDLVKTAYYSLAKRVADALNKLQQITGEKLSKVFMTGGATKAEYFLQTLKSIAKVDIVCLASEGASEGNAKRQFDMQD